MPQRASRRRLAVVGSVALAAVALRIAPSAFTPPAASQHVGRRASALLSGLVAAGLAPPLCGQAAWAEALPTPSPEELKRIGGAFQDLEVDPRQPGGVERLEAAEVTFNDAIPKYEGIYRAARPDAERSMLRIGRARTKMLINERFDGNRPDKAEEAILDYDAAIKIMEDDFRSNPAKALYSEYPDALVRRALVKEGLAKWEGAVDDYSKAIALWRPATPRADIPLRGSARPQEGDGLGVNPLVLNFRANALCQLNRYNEALSDYQEATDIFINDGEYRQAQISRANEALALYGAGEEEDAVKRMESVIKKDQGITDMHVALAAVYWERGEAARAENRWSFACENIDSGCGAYKDMKWVRGIRRWPANLADKLQRFLDHDSSKNIKI